MKKKFTAFLTCLFMIATVFPFVAACGKSNGIVIWTSGEDYKNEYYLSELRAKFPNYKINLEYLNSSTIAAKVVAEGKKCSADIILSEEYGYLEKCENELAELTEFDYSPFLDDIVPESRKFTPELKNGGCIVVNKSVLDKKNVSVPSSYEELTDPKYKDLIAMPNPSTSGTGYMFLRMLTNAWGESEAFEWFEKFSKNVLQYTSGGSGALNRLKQGEVGIALGMTSQAVVEKNDGVDFDIMFFEEGSPYSMYGNAVLKKSASRPEVMEVFDYAATELCKGNNERFFPDQIFKDFVPVIEGFPADIKYGDMKNDTLAEKELLLAKGTFA